MAAIGAEASGRGGAPDHLEFVLDGNHRVRVFLPRLNLTLDAPVLHAPSTSRRASRMSDSDDSEVDEETVARERAALREAMGNGPQPVSRTLPIPSSGGGSGDGDGDSDDESDDSETVAQERAALQLAMGAGGSALGLDPVRSPAPPPSASTSTSTSAPNPNRLGALALQRALMTNLAYQRLCHEELAAIERVLALHQQADDGPTPQNAHEALLAASLGGMSGAMALSNPTRPRP